MPPSIFRKAGEGTLDAASLTVLIIKPK